MKLAYKILFSPNVVRHLSVDWCWRSIQKLGCWIFGEEAEEIIIDFRK